MESCVVTTVPGHSPTSVSYTHLDVYKRQFQNNVVVERGIAAGEMIVTEGYHKLNPGMKVKVSDAAEDKKPEETL